MDNDQLSTINSPLSITTYDAYKDSGIEWLGEVPAHWEVKRIKDVTLVKRGASPRPIDDPVYFDEEGEYSWVRIADLTASDRYLLNTKEKLSILGASLSVKRYPGNFILSIAGTVGKPIITKIKCCIHDGFVWFPTLKINPEFLYYIFSTGLPYQGLGKLGTQLNLNTETVGLISIPTPSASEIERIVQHLDTQTALIDRQIDLLSQKAAQYGKLKQSLINETVTRGLDKTVALKDSGVEWIGDVPVHWGLRKLSQSFSQIGSGTTPKSGADIYYEGGTTNWINTGDLNDGILYSCKRTITDKALQDHSLTIYPAGSIIIAMYGATIGKVSISMIDGCTNQACCVLNESKTINVNFLFYWFISKREFIISLSYGGGQPNISQDTIKSLRIISPSFGEQQAIATYLDSKTAHIDCIVATLKTQIDKLKELRKTLINDVVTGKFKVHG